MRNAALVLCFIFIGLLGCSDKDGASVPVAPPPVLKPLPACEDQVSVELQTAASPLALKRTIEIGYRAHLPARKYSLDQGEVREPIKLDRGISYYVSIATENLDKTSEYKSVVIFVPTCENREAFQKLNPSYEEPIQLIETK